MDMCRTCLGRSPPFFPLFTEENYPDKILILTDIDVTEDRSSFPKAICKPCIENIARYLEFREKIQECTDILNYVKQETAKTDAVSANIEKLTLKAELRHDSSDKKLQENRQELSDAEESTEQIEKRNKTGQVQVKARCKSKQLNRKVSLNDIINTVIPKDTIYKCKKCDQYSTESRYNLYKHLVYKVCEPGGPMKHPDLPEGLYSCDECYFITDVEYYVTRHKQAQHINRKSRKSISDIELSCKICGKLIKKRSMLHHVKTHRDRVDCPVCKKSYSTSSLRSHLKTHNRKDCVCEVCGKVFEYEGLYKYHMANHTKPKTKYKCSTCGLFVFSLKKHMQTHTAERPNICDVCGKGLSSRHALKHHMRLHTDERPFNCTLCDCAFRVKVCLTNHLKSKHKVV